MATKPELLEVDPSTLSIGANIRRDPHAESLVSSLKTNGMLHPIRARKVDDGLEVIDGQRRTLAAIQAGMSTVPVLVVDASDTGRIFEQYVSNEHREGLTDAERVGTVKQLALMGLAAGTIAKRTGLTKTVVEQATTVTDTALELAPYGSLEDLAALAEIEGQPEHAEAALHLADGDVRAFRVAYRRSRGRVAADNLATAMSDAHSDLVILPAMPGYDDKQYQRLSQYSSPKLEHEDGTPVPPEFDSLEDAMSHLGASLAVCVSPSNGYGDALVSVTQFVDMKQLKTAGLRKAKTAPAGDEKSPEQREAERAEKERSKAWAETAADRKEWIARLFTAKTTPTGWERLVLPALLHGARDLAYSDVQLAAVKQMLGFDHLDLDVTDSDPITVLEHEILRRPDRLEFAVLALAIANVEETECRMQRGYYYAKPFATHGHLGIHTSAYLDVLESWGYDAAAERTIIAGQVSA